MLFVIKALLGTGVIGGGIVAPIALSQSSKRSEVSLAEELGTTFGKTVANLGNVFFEVSAREATNQKIRLALGEIDQKKCALLQNQANSEYWFNALYACNKDDRGNVDFYYLSSESAFKANNETKFIKKVSSVNYVEENDTTAKLVLAFEDGSTHNWSVVSGSMWKDFKNVNIGEQCKVKNSGENYLRCVIRDAGSNNYFTHLFQPF
ncbi:hypothetical protein WEN_00190 [Mycoplasma wenyonii str. Massachusetts]|uniref:Uncharacterized protein n=1 Tax=Mycoplasma wenyonii (strain Massachusetts) TaxID=1197325 RepID=I6ZI54_MYCWM|nr:hypothetical protein [Mycoplasma wenyonii]AFN64845.1 hypothetical protein WEN_00190 [Mycoplasma wenyonii str. Massachusetts]